MSLRILRAGDAVLGKETWAFFKAHPVAAIEIIAPYLSAAFGAMLSGDRLLLRTHARRSVYVLIKFDASTVL